MSHLLPFATPEMLRSIIAGLPSPLERGVVRNVAARIERGERCRMIAELNALPPADLAKIDVAASRVERQQNLMAARADLANIRCALRQQFQDIAALKRYFGRR